MLLEAPFPAYNDSQRIADVHVDHPACSSQTGDGAAAVMLGAYIMVSEIADILTCRT